MLRRSTLVSVLVSIAVAAMVASAAAVTRAAASSDALWNDPGPGIVSQADASDLDVFIVRHQAPPLALYRGEVPGLAATSPEATGAARLDATSPAAQAYLDHLADQQDLLLDRIEAALDRSVDVRFRYRAAFNGFALGMDLEEAAVVAALPGVADVQRDRFRTLHTDNGPAWIGAETEWGTAPVPGTDDGGTDDGTDDGGRPGKGNGDERPGNGPEDRPGKGNGSDRPGNGGSGDGETSDDGASEGTFRTPNLGEGVVVGVIDTGINHDHPSFADVGPVDGYDHDNPRGRFYGACDPVTGAPLCNDKLIGAYDFTGTGPEDDNGHGSHTASTTAGNVVDALMDAPTIDVRRTLSGVAPHANVISYKGCSGLPVGCQLSALVAAIDQATIDAVDVINYSIGGGTTDPWTDADALAYLGARTAGIFTATSAGNDGPGAATLGSPGDAPWITTVAASTHDRKLFNALVGMTGGATTPPADISGKSLTSALPAAPVVYAGDYGSALCGEGAADPTTGASEVNPFPPGTFDGEIVVCDRGTYGRVAKAENVAAGGAGGYVLANDEENGDSLTADAYPIPGVHISYEDGLVLKAWLADGGSGHAGAIQGTVLQEAEVNGDQVAGFSSRGPNVAVPGVLKPDVTAPGVDILAAYASPLGTGLLGDGADTPEYNVISGTSMSSPHTAGAAALLRARHPGWTPDQVKSALMTTSSLTTPDGTYPHRKEDGVTPADPLDIGAGRVDLRYASDALLSFGETTEGYLDANPSAGGDPSALNLPSFSAGDCDQACSWTRTVEHVGATPATWTVAAQSADIALTVTPTTVTLAPGETAEITVDADTSAITERGWHFGQVTLTPDAGFAQRLPVAAHVYRPPSGTALHFQGGLDEGCTGAGPADVVACNGPFLLESDALDAGAPAVWQHNWVGGILNSNPRNVYAPNWTYPVDAENPATVGGVATINWWTRCASCSLFVSETWRVSVYADGAVAPVYEAEHDVFRDGPTSLMELAVELPEFTAQDSITLKLFPVFGVPQQETEIFYDSTQPCPGTTQGPCDSVVWLPLTGGTDGGGGEDPPPAGTPYHFQGNLDEGCSGDGQADVQLCGGPFLDASDVLDSGAAARFKHVPLASLVSGDVPDPSWTLTVDETTAVEGPVTVRWWSSCATCQLYTGEDWTLQLTADGSPRFTQRVTLERLAQVDQLEVVLDVPYFEINDHLTLTLTPMFVNSQPDTEVFYDSTEPCPGASDGPCDSVVYLPFVPLGSGSTEGPIGPGAATTTGPDPLRAFLWGLDQVRADQAWTAGGTLGAGAVVAVVDTGIQLGHPDLAENVIAGNSFIQCGDAGCGNGNWLSPNDGGHYHGTHVAGTIGAVKDNGEGVVGVAPEAGLMAVRVLNGAGFGTSRDVGLGIRYAVDNGAHVINMSLGDSPGSQILSQSEEGEVFLRESVQYAIDNGVVVVASAGNDFASICGTPSWYEGALCVASTTRHETPAEYSNQPVKPDFANTVAAPGGDLAGLACDDQVLSAVPYGTASPAAGCDFGPTNSYDTAAGTSMAAPHVSGVAALLVSLGCSAQQTVELVTSTARTPVAGTNDGLYDPVYGRGIVDAEAATTAALSACGAAASATGTAGTSAIPSAVPGAIPGATPTLVHGAPYAVEPR